MLFSGAFIGTSFASYGEYSEAEVALMRAYIRPGDTVLDIGANIGDLTLPLAQMVGPTGSVIAVESSPDTFAVLCGNLALNQVRNVIPHNAFIKIDDAAIVRPQFVRADRTPTFMTIDQMNLATCRLIKIDVDGNERDVLKSAEATVTRHRPILYFENDKKPESEALLTYVASLGYRLYWHFAPLYNPDNFFGRPANVWAPNNMISVMILGLPQESDAPLPPIAEKLYAITDPKVWWQDFVDHARSR
jgi:hypothetical protein